MRGMIMEKRNEIKEEKRREERRGGEEEPRVVLAVHSCPSASRYTHLYSSPSDALNFLNNDLSQNA